MKETKEHKDAKAFIVDVNEATNEAADALRSIASELAAIGAHQETPNDIALQIRSDIDKIVNIAETLEGIAAHDKRIVPQEDPEAKP